MWALLLFLSLASASDFYTAAVVEFSPSLAADNGTAIVSRTEALSIMIKNLARLEAHVASATNQGAQIVVFPEDSLYGIFGGQHGNPTREMVAPYCEQVPIPMGAALCDVETPSVSVLSYASCMAKKYGVVIVMTMAAAEPCTRVADPNCPSDGQYQFNTQLAFNESGSILAGNLFLMNFDSFNPYSLFNHSVYHKTHLFFEPQFDAGPDGQMISFTTSFGVRFGLVICFDLQFYYPAVGLVESGVSKQYSHLILYFFVFLK